MADPLHRPLKWSKNFQIYVEKHNLYDVLQELLKQMIISKPKDSLVFIRDEIQKVAKGIYNPRNFIVGSKIAEVIGKRLATGAGAKFLQLDEIIKQSDPAIKTRLEPFLEGPDKGDDTASKLLVATVHKRLAESDCEAKGYVLYGFPQNKAQAVNAQQIGLLPRQVFVFLPETGDEEEPEREMESDGIAPKKSLSKLGVGDWNHEMYFMTMKDIATAYHYDICKMISYDKVLRTPRAELEAELLGILMTWKPTGGPFIPRVVIMGPPASGKSSIAEFLSTKFTLVNVDWIELVRGAVRWGDEVSAKADAFLKNLVPMSEEAVKTIISRRLQQDDCEKKGWILHGFPESLAHCKVLEALSLEPNRVFMLSCSQELSVSRMAKQKKVVMKRQLEGTTPAAVNEAGDNLIFPFALNSVTKRYRAFTKSLDKVIQHFGSRIIYVDTAMKPTEVKNFVETSIHRPPIPQKN